MARRVYVDDRACNEFTLTGCSHIPQVQLMKYDPTKLRLSVNDACVMSGLETFRSRGKVVNQISAKFDMTWMQKNATDGVLEYMKM